MVDSAGDVVIEADTNNPVWSGSWGSGSLDTVQSTVSFTLGANLEILTLTGTGAINGTGNSQGNFIAGNSLGNVLDGGDGADSLSGGAGNDTLIGGIGADTLDGGTGADSMAGGLGNDIYTVDDPGDFVFEALNEGTDLVNSSVAFTLSDNVENLTLTGTGVINGTGNSLDNVITGNSLNNVLDGGLGNDTLSGGAGNDTLFGGAGSDSLSGGAGTDSMVGGAGDDIYVVDAAGDIIVENAGEGSDTVQSSITYTLTDLNLENLTLTGTTAINGTGNTLANILIGNSLANVLTGLDGDDMLDGGAGADTLIGGTGNDTYVVDNASDVVTEALNEGTDLVKSSVSYTLGANVENLTLTGTVAINGIGNSMSNIITGNSLANTLDGGLGADTLIGGLGNDTYIVDNAGDVIVENLSEGTDLVQAGISYTLSANVENLTLTGTGAINGTGNSLDNIITGNSLANILTGGAGNDTYVVDNAGDVVVENASEGTDLVQSSISYTLGSDVENLTLTGTGVINGTGNSLDNVITGNSLANVLTGGAGNDSLVGGAGDDSIFGGAGSDTLTGGTGNDQYTYFTGEGDDVITADAASNVDTLFFADANRASLNYSLIGNDLVISIAGATGSMTLKNWALGGNNQIGSIQANDGAAIISLPTTALTGTSANDILMGTIANDIIYGLAGSDSINGGLAGADTMIGALGDDTYVVDNAGDVVVENPGEGTDLVQSSVSYSLSSDVENLTLTGTATINGGGNSLSNIITGNSLANVLTGGMEPTR